MKIIAIRPLEDCQESYLKILTSGELYYLCNNYEIDKNEKISETYSLPEGFFSNQKVKINVHAIVGKNGSGKSTLIELLFRIINNIAYKYQKIKVADLIQIKGIKIEMYYYTDTFYKVRIIDSDIKFYKYDGRNKSISIPLNNKAVNLKDFFYSIVVNYSHYAYNVMDMDEDSWIDGLFHKNDGYRTPIVLNPLRTNGNVDINSENHLVKSRLISNLLLPIKDDHFRKITSGFHATHLVLSVNRNNKRNKVLYTKSQRSGEKKVTFNDLNIDEVNLLSKLDHYYKFKYVSLDKRKNKTAIDYVLYKLVSIALKYYNHEEIYFLKEKDAFDESRIEDFFKKLFEDTSHITLKLRQTINFLKFQHLDLKKQTITLDSLTKINNQILSKRNTIKVDNIELVPPPIFNVEILLTPEKERSKKISFRTLSSGEKQMIYSVSSVLYHILNLESVPSNAKKRTAYRYINIVLEEIEMYAHPEMQRSYVKYILGSIERLALVKTLGINICFVTHSPFILSDIPESNILFLNEFGKPEPVFQVLKTFGGNIHDLLAHSFFLKDGAIGAFAFDKINGVIKKLNSDQTFSVKEKIDLIQNINLIGEPFLRNKILDMYYSKFDKSKRIHELEAELEKLKSE